LKRQRGRPPGTTGRAAVLNSHQIRAVAAVARARPRLGQRALATFVLSIGTGLRAKELSSLRWIDLFTREGEVREVVHLKAAYTKGAKTRDIFLSSPKLRRVLEEYHEENRPWDFNLPLFASQKGGHMTATSMARFLKQLYIETGIPRASSHSGRRTMITQLAEKGIDLKAISVIAGHSNVRTTALYVEHNPARLARILQEVTW